jgi:hypothetical protein
MADEKKTNRQLLGERYKSRNPEFNVDDDEALYGEALGELAKSDEAEAGRQRLNETIANNAIAPEMLNGIISGKDADGNPFDLDQYLLDQHIDYLLDYMEDNATAKAKADARRLERDTQKKNDAEFEAKVAEKTAAEDAELDAAIKEAGYTADQVKDLIDWIYDKDAGFITRAARFELKKEDFLRLFHIKDYDLKMKEADDAGYKRGKNEKIDMFKRKQQQRKEMPADVGSGGGTPASGGPAKDPYLERLERMKNM